jgi:Spy/CpxP family protein refolding chaperone
MSRLRRWVACGLLAGAMTGPGVALATGKGAPADAASKADREKLRNQIFDQLRAERMWKLTDALKLDEASAARVFPLLSKYDEQERSLGRERGETHRELRQIVESPSPDTARLDALIDKLVALRGRRHELEVEKLAALRKVLKPLQMAKLMMLVPRMDDSFRRRIHDALEGADGEANSNSPAARHGGGGRTPLVGQP